MPFPSPGVRNWEHFNISGAKQEVVKEEEGERSGHQITVDLKNFFFLGCAGFSLLHGLFSNLGERNYFLVAVCRLLIAVASFVVEHGP